MREVAGGRPRAGGFRFSSKLERRIIRRVGAAVGDHGLIEDGDHLLVAVSGGKDSLSMLDLLTVLARRAPVRFEMTVVTIQGDGQSTERLEDHLRSRGCRWHLERVPIGEIVAEKLQGGAIPCALCSRLRRGVLYTLAPRIGCNKIALGHHLDDLVETLLLNFFFAGQLRSMAPRLVSDDRRNVVIRPLCYVPESWLEAYSRERSLPVSSCASCAGSVDSQRVQVKRMVAELASRHPGVRWQMLRALRNVRAEHLLDRELLGRVGR